MWPKYIYYYIPIKKEEFNIILESKINSNIINNIYKYYVPNFNLNETCLKSTTNIYLSEIKIYNIAFHSNYNKYLYNFYGNELIFEDNLYKYFR